MQLRFQTKQCLTSYCFRAHRSLEILVCSFHRLLITRCCNFFVLARLIDCATQFLRLVHKFVCGLHHGVVVYIIALLLLSVRRVTAFAPSRADYGITVWYTSCLWLHWKRNHLRTYANVSLLAAVQLVVKIYCLHVLVQRRNGAPWYRVLDGLQYLLLERGKARNLRIIAKYADELRQNFLAEAVVSQVAKRLKLEVFEHLVVVRFLARKEVQKLPHIVLVD